MIVDIDETVPDNSDDQAWLITDATSYRAIHGVEPIWKRRPAGT